MAAVVQHPPQQMGPQPPLPPLYTRHDVMQHCEDDDCWIIVHDRVYDVTKFLIEHPGGHEIILEYAGMDATAAFFDKGHSPDAHQMLQQYFMGILAQNP